MLSSCGGPAETLEDHRPLYEGWCAYKIETGVVSVALQTCVNDAWNRTGSMPMQKSLHKSFSSVMEMNQYIRGETALRIYCEMIKDEPTMYEELLGVTRIGELSYEDCRNQLIQLNMLSAVLQDVPVDIAANSAWSYEPGVTYRISGKVYNDPFGLDYKNGPEDTWGDGR